MPLNEEIKEYKNMLEMIIEIAKTLGLVIVWILCTIQFKNFLAIDRYEKSTGKDYYSELRVFSEIK